MTNLTKSKQPKRPHFIPEWAEKKRLSQADLAKELDADKSVVSRWFHGTTPGVRWQERLGEIFDCAPEALFRHPDEQRVPIRTNEEILETLERMEGLTRENILTLMSIIEGFRAANRERSERMPSDGQPEPAIPRHESQSSK